VKSSEEAERSAKWIYYAPSPWI